MIYLFDTNVVAELTTRAKPDPRVLPWFRSMARPNRFLSVITVAEIEAGVAAAPDPVRQPATHKPSLRYGTNSVTASHLSANRKRPPTSPSTRRSRPPAPASTHRTP